MGRIITLAEDFLSSFREHSDNKKLEIPSFTQIFFHEEKLAESFNEVESQTNTSKHSEILGIEIAQMKLQRKFLTDCTLITMIEPCLMCSGAIINSRIPKVIYLLESKKVPGLSSLSLESIYSENHFPEVCFEFSKDAEEIVRSYFRFNLRQK